MDIVENTLIAWIAPDSPPSPDGRPAIERTERILYVDPIHVWAYTIDIQRERALPQLRAVAEIEAVLQTPLAELVLNDPWTAQLLLSETSETGETSLKPRHVEIRDNAYAAIKPLVEGNIVALLDPGQRGKLVDNRANEVGCSVRALYNWLSRYWQRGMTPNALLPRFPQCGAPSSERIVQNEIADSAEYTPRGRPTKWRDVGAPNMTTERLERFKTEIERAMRLYPGATRLELFRHITEECYHVGIEVQDKAITYILAPQSERPSFSQFTYWYNKLTTVEEQERHKYGDQEFARNHREVLGDSTAMAFGPNSQLQIDAFDSGVPLVDGITRRHILGSAIVHLGIDTFARFITGFGVRVRGPDWEGAMLAVYNSAEDKVTFCRHYGVTISEHEWPSRYVCHTLLADRGEFKGNNADHLPVAVGIEIENTAPYRGDMKAIIERHVGLIKHRHLVHLDGAYDGVRQRGDPNPLPEACLTPYEFTAILIRAILFHNNWQELKTYTLSPEMLADGVRPVPLDLWEWGVKYRSGALRTKDQRLLWKHLLPSDDAIVNERGIWFKGKYRYDCGRAHREGWYVKARKPKNKGGGSWHVRAAYLPNRPGEIYLRLKQPDNSYIYETCALHASMADFAQYDWLDLETATDQRKADSYDLQEAREQAAANLQAHIDQILDGARAATDAATAGVSQASRQKDRREHRKLEQALASPTGVWPAPPSIVASPSEPAHMDRAANKQKRAKRQETAHSQYVPASMYQDILSGMAPALDAGEAGKYTATDPSCVKEKTDER